MEGLPSHSFDDILGFFDKLLLVLLPGGYWDILQGVPEVRRCQFGIHWVAGRKESAQPPEAEYTRGRGGYREVRVFLPLIDLEIDFSNIGIIGNRL